MKLSSKVYVDVCRFGKGVFAAVDIQAGERILTFTGRMIGLEQALSKRERSGDPLQIGNTIYLDLEPPGVLVNHSCAPNAGITRNVELIALRKIGQGEEILFDYSTTMHDGVWTMHCACGSKACRGLISDFHTLPETLRQQYLALGIVQSFILDSGSKNDS